MGRYRMIFLGLVFAIVFVMAASAVPIDLAFEGNTTPQYDGEGIFSVNWTSGGGDEVNYSIYVSVDGGASWYLKGYNDSATGYSFSNTTDANYTFVVEAVNGTLDTANSSYISMVVDTTDPLIESTYPASTNYVTAPTTFNYTYTETNCENVWYSSDSGTTNYSVQSCGANFSSMIGAEGSNTWIVYMNDSVGNENSSSVTFVFDTTDPVASASCSPSSVDKGDTVTCTCSGTDSGGSGINSSLTTAGSTPSTSSTGTFEYTCSVTDNVGNSDSDTDDYTVTSSSYSGGSNVYPIYRPNVLKMNEGYTVTLGRNYKVNFEFDGEDHVFVVDEILEDSVRVTVSSDPVTLEITEGDTEKVDLDGDGDYDLTVELKDARGSRADFVLSLISEDVDDGVVKNVSEGEDFPAVEDAVKDEADDKVEVLEEGSLMWLWIVLVLVVVTVVAWKKGLFKEFGL